MQDNKKTQKQLIKELTKLRRRITELEAAGYKRNQFEEALRKERDKAQHYLDIAEVMLVALNNKGEITLINRKGNQILGYKEGELLGRNWFMTCVPSYRRKKLKNGFLKLMAGAIKLTEFYEDPALTKTGTERIMAWHNTLLKDAQGNPLGTLSSGMDITESKQAEEALHKSEDKYRTILKNIEEGYYEVDLAGNFTFFNDAVCRIWGYPKEELMGMNNRQYTDKETAKRVFQVFNKVYKTGKIGKGYDYEIIKKDGTRSYVETSISLRKDSAGKAIGFRGIIRDITERKQAEEALRQKTEESERQYRTTINSMGDAIHVIDKNLRFVLFNDAFKRWNKELGLKTDVIGRRLAEVFPFLPKKIGDEYRRVFDTGQPLITEENTKINGRAYITETRKIPIFEGSKVTRIATIIRNITARKQTENAIHESKRMLEKIFSSLRDALLIIDANTLKIIDCNPAASEIFGYDRNEIIGQAVKMFHVDKKMNEEFKNHLFNAIEKQGFLSRFEFKMKHKDGSIFPTEHNVTPIEDEQGNRIIWVSVVRDITESRRAGAALRESEATLRALINAPTDSILLLDPQGIILDLNEIAAERLEKSREELIGTLADASLPEDVAKKRRSIISQILKTGREIRFEDERGGIWFDTVAHPITDKDGVIGKIAIIARDITERKRAEEQIRESRQRFQGLVETLSDWIWEVDEKGVYTYASPRVRELLGFEPEEFLGKTPFDLMPLEEAERIKSTFERLLAAQQPIVALENTNRHKDGRLVVFETSGMPFFDAEGRFKGYRGVDRNITDRKQAEEALKERQETINAIIETSRDWIWAIDSHGVHTYSNPAIERILGYRPEEIIGNTSLDLIHEDDKKMVAPILQACQEKRCGWNNLLLRWRHKNGTYRYLESNAVPILNSNGDLNGFRGVDRDITERKQDEEALQQKTDELSWLNQQLEFVLGATKAGVDIIDADFNLIYIDRQWQQVYGDPTGRKCYEYFMGREQPCPTCGIPKALETKQTVVTEEVLPGENNRIIEVHTIPFQESDGSWRVAEFNLDITERKKLQETLDNERKELKLIIDSSPIRVFFKDKEGKYLRVNKTYAEGLKMPEDNFTGKTVFDFYSPQIAQGMTHDDQEVLQSGRPKLSIIEQYESASGVRWVQTDKIPIFDNDGITIGLMGFAQDITERKQADELIKIRLRMLEFAATHSLAELLQKTLDEVCEFTKSAVGFYHFVEEDQKTFSLQAWSTRTVSEFCQAAGKGMHYSVDQAGVWVDCIRERRPVIHNDYASLPHRKGMPEGHAAIVRELVVPIMRNNRFVGIIGIGNKPQDYTDQDIQVVSYLADVAWEIAARKLASESLEESEKKYRQVVENATDIIYTTDINGNFTYANSIALKVTGYSLEELQRFNYLDLVVPEYRDQLKKIYGNQFLTRQATTYVEFPFSNKLGKVMWFGQNASLMLEGGKIIGFQVIARDISERKQAEAALQESEEKYRDLVENINDIIYATDESGTVTYISPTIEPVGGYTPSEVIGRSFLEFVYQEDMSTVVQFFKQDISGQAAPHEYRMVAKAGDIRWIRVSSRPFFEGDRIVGLRGVLADITARKQAEEEIKRGYEQLQETLHATVNALAATVEMKDQYTAGHQPRVTRLACTLAEEMGLSEDRVEGIRMAASIHDIGKIMVPAEILNKPGPLTEIQYEMIKMHSQAGHDILKGLKLPWPVAQIILQHHERMDGSGYPQGLSGEKIMLEARILAVANVVEAMNAHRPYRPAYDIQEALAEISKNRGTFYDAAVVDACLRLFNEKGFVLDSLPQ